MINYMVDLYCQRQIPITEYTVTLNMDGTFIIDHWYIDDIKQPTYEDLIVFLPEAERKEKLSILLEKYINFVHQNDNIFLMYKKRKELEINTEKDDIEYRDELLRYKKDTELYREVKENIDHYTIQEILDIVF
jgi:hypothetical protein